MAGKALIVAQFHTADLQRYSLLKLMGVPAVTDPHQKTSLAKNLTTDDTDPRDSRGSEIMEFFLLRDLLPACAHCRIVNGEPAVWGQKLRRRATSIEVARR